MSERSGPTDAKASQGPTDLPGTSWWAAVRRSVGEFRRDNVTDWAAALTYYSVLSIFPAMLVVVSVVGLAGTSASGYVAALRDTRALDDSPESED